ncbi:transcriptional regulator [Streptomyces sp. NPDC002446]
MTTTTGRLAGDSSSWLQAVHWAYEAGLHPRFHATTLRLARVLAELNPCRPGIAYLMRRLKVSERTVQYHLAALRDTGLLAYICKGGRRAGLPALASEFARVIPVEFDTAVGIRTLGEGIQRRVVGIAESGRKLIAALATKAAAGQRRRRRTKRTGRSRCTPKEVRTSCRSSADRNTPPSEREREATSPPQRRGRGNFVARRYRLAAELVRRVPWLHRAAVPRIAWVARHVSDAGWSASEVIAWLNLAAPARRIHRPSAFLAYRLRGAEKIWSAAARREAAEQDRDSRHSAALQRREYAYEESGPPPAVSAAIREGLRQGLSRLASRRTASGRTASGQGAPEEIRPQPEGVELPDTLGRELPDTLGRELLVSARSQPDWDEAAAAFDRLLGSNTVNRAYAQAMFGAEGS